MYDVDSSKNDVYELLNAEVHICYGCFVQLFPMVTFFRNDLGWGTVFNLCNRDDLYESGSITYDVTHDCTALYEPEPFISYTTETITPTFTYGTAAVNSEMGTVAALNFT